ncbi:MAG: hypothetical protein KKF39_02175, partial [Nanoarchaeota archaeon]|nr:hypothetical protein [Nanoarchaeota archaeon]
KDPNTNWKYILIVLALSVLVGGGILGYQEYTARQETPTPTSPIEETANWKVYRNEEYGFEVKYPEDWFIADGKFEKAWASELNSFQLIFARSKEDIEIAFHEGKLTPLTHGWYELNVYVEERSFIEEGVNILSLASKREQCQVIDFSGVRASRCLWKGVNEIGDRLGPNIGFDYKGRKWIISWPTLLEDTFEYDPVYDQILSTFQFLD